MSAKMLLVLRGNSGERRRGWRSPAPTTVDCLTMRPCGRRVLQLEGDLGNT